MQQGCPKLSAWEGQKWRKRKCLPAALVYWPHSEEGEEEETRGRKEEGNGATVEEEGGSKREVFCYGSMYPQLVVLWRKLVQLILQHPNCTLSGGQVGGSEIMQWWLTTCKLKTLTASICAFSTSACRLWRSKQMDNTELCLYVHVHAATGHYWKQVATAGQKQC